MTPKKCSIEQHLVPAGGPNQEIGDSVAARGKNGETDSYNPSFGGPPPTRELGLPPTREGKSCWILHKLCFIDDNSLFQQSFSEHISSEHFAVTVILILLEADKLSLAWV